MKKLITVLCIIFLITGMAIPLSASDDLFVEIAPDGPITVPYDITYFFFTHDKYEVNSQWEAERLLDLVYRSKKDYVVVYPTEEISELTKEMLTQFATEHEDECWSKGSVRKSGKAIILDIFWKQFDYKLVPVLNNAKELYEAVQESKTHPTYDKVYRVSEDYLSYTEYLDSRLETIADDVFEKYGEDVSPYLLHSTTRFISSHSTHYIFVSVGVTSHYEYDEQQKEAAQLGRYYDILENSVHIPITDDMTDIEKIAILQASVGNVIRLYEITYAPLQEVTYSIGVGQCMHFAWVFKYFCDIYGIECEYVSGDVTWADDPHAWNAVKCDGNWYMFDPQWMVRGDSRNLELKHLSVSLCSAEKMKDDGYIWRESKYPACTAESISYSGEEYFKDADFPEGTKKYEMIDTYRSSDPVGGGGVIIYYDIYFHAATGTIYAIDCTLFDDTFEKDKNGMWQVKETVLEIPAEIDGVKVKRIAGDLSDYKSMRNIFYERGFCGFYDKVIIPDGITLDDFALGGIRTELAIIGDNVTAGYSSLPHFGSNGRAEVGDNFIYKGEYTYPGEGKLYKKSYDYYDEFTGKEIVMFHSDAADLKNDEDYPFVYYSGYGCNIVDAEPVKTITLCKETKYIDPRLNRLNRKFVVDAENPYYTSVDGVLYNKDMTKLVSVPVGVSKLEIPGSVTEIGEYAFAYCHGISDVVIPASVDKIGNRAFFHMSALEAVYFEGQVPEGFEPYMCGDFRQVFRNNASDMMPKYTIDGTQLRIQPPTSGGKTIIVFYDKNNKITEIKMGTTAEIPTYAKSFEVYCWDGNMKPVKYKAEGTL